MSLAEPALATLALFIMGTLVGYWPTRRLIAMREARHELKQGSASFLRAMGGWVVVLAWLGATMGHMIAFGTLPEAVAAQLPALEMSGMPLAFALFAAGVLALGVVAYCGAALAYQLARWRSTA